MIAIAEPLSYDPEKYEFVAQGGKVQEFEDYYDAVRWYNLYRDSTNTQAEWEATGVKFLVYDGGGVEYRP